MTIIHSIMGEGEEVGVVPQFCRELFDRITGSATNKVGHTSSDLMINIHNCCVCVCVSAQEMFKVQVSYYEIYKEKIYDLLASTTARTKPRVRTIAHTFLPLCVCVFESMVCNVLQLRVREHPVMGPYVEDLST